MPQYFTSGQVAKQLRISISTLKRWLENSKVEISNLRNSNGWRLFSQQDLETLRNFKSLLKKNGKQFTETTLIPVAKETTLRIHDIRV